MSDRPKPRMRVIAECGSSHGGSLSDACFLIRVAADCGAWAAKFQYWSDAARLADRRHAPELLDAYKEMQVPRSWLPVLAATCKKCEIEFACTTFLPEDVYAVAEHCDVMKISSFECCDRELLSLHRGLLANGKVVIVSFGMDASTRLADTLLAPVTEGHGGSQYHRLHCVSAYPIPDGRLGLSKMAGTWNTFRMDGFSDHSPWQETWSGALAVAAGARIVERHLRLDTTPESNPDFPHSMPPELFETYVGNIMRAETALLNPENSEAAMMKYRVVSA